MFYSVAITGGLLIVGCDCILLGKSNTVDKVKDCMVGL